MCVKAYLPSCFVEHTELMAWPDGIGNDKTRSYHVEGCINVHGIWVIKAENMEIVALSEVPLHPFNAKIVGHLCVCIMPVNANFPLTFHTVHYVNACVHQ